MAFLDGKFGNPTLEKLKIFCYKTEERLNPHLDKFEAQFNPESLSTKFTTKYDKPQGIGQSGQALTYINNPPMEMKLKLVFDNILDKEDIAYTVRRFLDITWKPFNNTHEPNYLKLIFGKITFPCRLGSVDIKYTRFGRTGVPTAAELDIVLLGDDEDKRRILKDNFSSPDLTHLRIVRSGDTLPLLCQDIYGDSCYYPVVALANDLDDFRNLQPGTKLYFPPLT